MAHILHGEFQQFLSFMSRGNVLDLAIATIIGGAFSGVVDSLTKDVLGPLLDLVTPALAPDAFVVVTAGENAPYSDRQEAIKDGAVIIGYGPLLQSILNFLIKGLCLFLIVRLVTTVTK